MSFQAKRLRVQLPCGKTTVLPCGEASLCGETAAVQNFAADVLPRCDVGTFVCGFGSGAELLVVRAGGCGPNNTCNGSPKVRPGPEGPDTILLDDVDLPVLRAQLEAQLQRIKWQLSDIETAEKALEDPGLGQQ